ncbi:MAG: hypothetical protein JXB00_11895 [Bacteroidales bacterium]|nr:hypothetical protein [Bacteroidales bacterium]
MKIFKIHILLIVFVFFFIAESCHKRPKPAPAQINWLSDDPLTIPFRVRKQKFDKGNLVWNNSFEKGKNIIIDSTGVTFRIDGWQKVGNRVEWVNLEADSIYASDEAYDSLRAIKIHRPLANETDDPGEGVISDFIRVIPGNFQLTFYIRLKDLAPNRSRLGTRIFDAVNIKMLFYDKNKIEIKPQKYNPVDKTFFDNSFKGYSFSNFWNIKNLPWSRVIGKSCDIYSIDGDIPSDARYVKLFFGLKGSGTMWVDMIDLRYSSENFSILERMGQFMDTTLYKQEIIIPTPKKVTKLASVPLYSYLDNPVKKPVIIIPRNVSGETMSAARLIQARISGLAGKTAKDSLFNRTVEIKSMLSTREMNSSKLIFSIGKTDLYLRFKDILPDIEMLGSEQGYFIYSASDLNNIVFLLGKTPAGDFYAATTAWQLFDNRKLIFHNANIIDFPDFSSRNIGLISATAENTGYLTEAAMAKINGIMLPADYLSGRTISHLISGTESKLGNNSIVSFGMIQHFPTQVKSGYSSFLNGGENGQIEKIVLFPGPQLQDCTSEHTVGCEIMRELCRIFESIQGSVPKYIYPVFRNNASISQTEGRAEFCLDVLNNCIPENRNYLWSGSSEYSFNTDNVDLYRIKGLTGKEPVFWDNSTNVAELTAIGGYYPGKLRCYNIFEPFNNSSIKYLHPNDGNKDIFFTIPGLSELEMVKMLSVADFAWNMDNYDADFSVWKILLSRYGLSCAKELVNFADIYADLMRSAAELTNPLHHQRLVRNAEELFLQLEGHLQLIKGYLGDNHPLYQELKLMSDEQLKQFRKINAP